MSKEFQPRHIVAVLVRLVAVGIFVYWLNAIAVLYGFFRNMPEAGVPVVELTLYIAPIFIAIFLWKFPMYVATKLWSGDGGATDHESLSTSALYTLGFVLLGVWLLFWSISDTAYWWAYFTFLNVPNMYGEVVPVEMGASNKANMVATVVEFILSLVLIFGGEALAKFVVKLRYAN